MGVFGESNGLLDNIKVTKAELLVAISKNKTAHALDVAHTLELRRDKVIEYLTEQSVAMQLNDNEQVTVFERFPMPEDHTQDYERAHRMVSMTQDDVIVLSETQFNKLVLDKWDWTRDLISTNTFYGKL